MESSKSPFHNSDQKSNIYVQTKTCIVDCLMKNKEEKKIIYFFDLVCFSSNLHAKQPLFNTLISCVFLSTTSASVLVSTMQNCTIDQILTVAFTTPDLIQIPTHNKTMCMHLVVVSFRVFYKMQKQIEAFGALVLRALWCYSY